MSLTSLILLLWCHKSILIPTEVGLSILFSLIIIYSGKHTTTVSIYHTIFCFDIYPLSLWCCAGVCWNIRGIRKKKIKYYSARARARFVFVLVYLEASHAFLLTTFSWLRTLTKPPPFAVQKYEIQNVRFVSFCIVCLLILSVYICSPHSFSLYFGKIYSSIYWAILLDNMVSWIRSFVLNYCWYK